MPLLSLKEVLNLKLSSIPLPYLKNLASQLGQPNNGRASDIIKRIIQVNPDELSINNFIKERFNERIQERRLIISDEDLKKELLKVKNFSWGVVQGQLDQKNQTEYVRRIVRYDDLVNNVSSKLHGEVTNYVICTWFNHWTTVLIEDHISTHNNVIPTIKNVKGIDIFFDGQPFDLKVTYLPRGYNPDNAMSNPIELARWMYENQGAQRFGDDNRLFVVLLNKNDPDKSWKLKRDYDFLNNMIDNFFDKEIVSENDEIVFSFQRKSYTTVTKVLIITK